MRELTPIYGNHVGFVINDQDPENRNRVQVFIPHLSTTLGKDWNLIDNPEGIEDKVFKQGDLTNFGDDVLNRLKTLLPWAECAAPLFGLNGTTHTGGGEVKTQPQTVTPPTVAANNSTTADKETSVNSDTAAAAKGFETKNELGFTPEQIAEYRNGEKNISLTEEQQTGLQEYALTNNLSQDEALKKMMGEVKNPYGFSPSQIKDSSVDGNRFSRFNFNDTQTQQLESIKSKYGLNDEDAAKIMTQGIDAGTPAGAPATPLATPSQNTPDGESLTPSNSFTGSQFSAKSQKDFYDKMYTSIYTEAQKQGVQNPDVIARLGTAQTSLETGWGKHLGGVNNYFGIKETRKGVEGSGMINTVEEINGQKVVMKQRFRAYNNMEESAADYVKFLKVNPRYKGVLASTTIDEALAAQGRTGYATGSNYGAAITNINNQAMGGKLSTSPLPSRANFLNGNNGNVAGKAAGNNSTGVLTGKKIDQTSGLRGHDIRSPNGMFSVPPPGTMVWVFFLNGSHMCPVYFAAVTEPNAGNRTSSGNGQEQMAGSTTTASASSSQTGPTSGASLNSLSAPPSGGNLCASQVVANAKQTALGMGGYNSTHYCYRGVKTSLVKSGLVSSYAGMAQKGGKPEYAKYAGSSLESNGFVKIDPSQQRPGDVRVYDNPGQPGHIAIVGTNGGEEYSDFVAGRPANMPLLGVYRSSKIKEDC